MRHLFAYYAEVIFNVAPDQTCKHKDLPSKRIHLPMSSCMKLVSTFISEGELIRTGFRDMSVRRIHYYG